MMYASHRPQRRRSHLPISRSCRLAWTAKRLAHFVIGCSTDLSENDSIGHQLDCPLTHSLSSRGSTMNKMLPPALSRPIAVAVGLLACGVNLNVVAHGYVSEPEGRSYLCKLGDNTGCGAVQWEPQSVEGPDGNPRFPIEGPEDGTIAAAGSPTWSELNAQTPSRWYKHDFAAGYQTFEWTFTANHASRDSRRNPSAERRLT